MEIIGGRTKLNGWFFYCCLWSCWIVLTFIVPKSLPYRFYIGCFILMSIILSIYKVPIFHWSVNLTILIWMIGCMVSFAALPFSKRLYQICVSFIVMLVYVVFLLFELYDPIWVIVDRRWLLSFIIGTIAILMNVKLLDRIAATIIGLGMGEFLFAYVLFTTGIKWDITTPHFLDLCSSIGILILLWSGFEFVIYYLKKIYTPPSQIEKEKHKPG
ncbi:YphA family membrane protein [Bacillus oleivorans]|uniref:YphA family membrane protein n=1 Tax=Bacillus oleivorans TaxID=1448271 RepID=UPI003CCBD0E1